MQDIVYIDRGQKYAIHSSETESLGINLNQGPWIAGGAALSAYTQQDINDIDVYFATDEQKTILSKHMRELYAGLDVFESNNATTFKRRSLKNVQLIHPIFTSIQQVFDKFDFTVCQIATNGKGQFVATARAIADIESKSLKVNLFLKEKFITRWVKYNLYGYTMQTEEFVKYRGLLDVEQFNKIGNFDGNY